MYQIAATETRSACKRSPPRLERMAEEFGAQVPEHGVKVDFDVSQLIERIYLGPLLTEADVTAIRVAAKAHGLEDRIRITSMLGTPRYT